MKAVKCLTATAIAATLLAATGASAEPYSEAPMLAEQVAAGALPRVEERLPREPRIVEPVETIGQYGGVWRSGLRGGSDHNWMLRLMGYEPLIAFDRTFSGKIVPNLAASFESNDEGSAFTFTIREGLKWSDGTAFTSDDVMFFIEDVAANQDLNPTPPKWISVRDQLPTVEKVDDLTFKIVFPEPFGLFLLKAASRDGTQMTMMQKDYCSQFHPKYNEETLDQLIAEAGVDTWVDLFVARCAVNILNRERWQNPDRPSMEAWTIEQPYVGGSTIVTLTRNPYYHKVDPAGNQLPYIDGHRLEIGADVETLVLKAMNGEVDWQDRHINSNANKAVFVDNMVSGDYRLVDLYNASMNSVSFMLNLTHKDPTKRKVFQNKDFRIGLSHAVDRQAIIDSVFIGEGTPRQLAPHATTPFFVERLATQYLDYDPDLAAEHLDKVVPDKDGSGFRLGPDGERIQISLLTIPAVGDWVDALTLVVQYWQAVGIDAQLQVVDRTLFFERKTSNDVDAFGWHAEGGLMDGLLEPYWYMPFNDQSNFATLWANWYNDVSPNEEPPADVQRQMELYEQIKQVASADERNALFREILEIAADQFYNFGISSPPLLYTIAKNDMRNVGSHYWAWAWPTPAAAATEQYYFRR